VRGLHLLGDHVRVLSYVLAPIYWIWDDVRFLLILQSVAIAAGSLVLFRIGRLELPEHPGAVLAVCASYLLNPAVQNLNLDHAHPEAFGQTFILASIYFLRTSRPLAFGIAAGLAMSCKEDVPLVYVALGLWTAWQGQRVFGLSVAAVAGLYFAACLLVILPYFNGVGFFRAAGTQLLSESVRRWYDVGWLAARFLHAEALGYYFRLGLPLAFLFVLSPTILVAAVPALSANMLSLAVYQRTIDYHYTTSIVPFLYVATIFSLRKLARGEPVLSVPGGPVLRVARVSPSVMAVLVILPASVVAQEMFAKLGLSDTASLRQTIESGLHPRNREIREMLRRIPADASVSAHYSLVPHLSHRRRIYYFPNPFRSQNWGIREESPHDPETIEYIAAVRKPGAPVDPVVQHQLDEGFFRHFLGDDRTTIYERVSTSAYDERASCGDWNGDGKIERLDVNRLRDAIGQKRDCPLAVCDMDGNGKVTIMDLARIQRFVELGQGAMSCPPPSRP